MVKISLTVILKEHGEANQAKGMDKISAKKPHIKGRNKGMQRSQSNDNSHSMTRNYFSCGSNHRRYQRLAKDRKCHNCLRMGHLERYCGSKCKKEEGKKGLTTPQVKINQVNERSKPQAIKVAINYCFKTLGE